MSQSVGVVVMDYDQQPITTRCLRSLATGTSLPDLVVLVSNGREPFDKDCARALSRLPIVVLRPGRNLGCAGGRNVGLNYLARNTTVTRFLVLDNDTVVPPHFLTQVASVRLAPLEVIAPIIYDLSTGEVWSSGGKTEADGTVHQLTDVPPRYMGRRDVDWAPGACLLMERETWSCIGGFDTWMSFLYEDIEWCRRVQDLGGRILIWPELQLLHEAHQSLGGRWSPKRVHLWARNGTVFRIAVARAGSCSTVRWLWNESRLAARDLAASKMLWAVARVSGLAVGLLEAIRRRC